ncbi:unnamed protein product [Musa acuminata subsp. malaccensis]|uniref:(wild Malaysian banana) hypothetical protein n=1 Tax=Musa acuminata subsp. malaccensis TaxID=214687 RepID=A0A804JE82_MUSAM|nr:unnamed protein product [Musa acuminata subsp. malaccensis]
MPWKTNCFVSLALKSSPLPTISYLCLKFLRKEHATSRATCPLIALSYGRSSFKAFCFTSNLIHSFMQFNNIAKL